jgi:predicted protein tyrosine phosphatase
MGKATMSGNATKVLFVCSQNKLRSPTAEQVFSKRHDLEVDSAGTNNDAENPLTGELVAWADVIFAMEKTHRTKIQKKFRAELGDARLICLDIPDIYPFMDPDLVQLLKDRVARYLPRERQTAQGRMNG